MKILGVGLSKTGTTSLHRALEILGCKSLHYDRLRLNDVLDGSNPNPDFHRYDDVDAVTDIPTASFYDELLEAYPDCKCILTVRDEDDWWRSIEHHSNVHRKLNDPEMDPFRTQLRSYIYGSIIAKEFLYRKRYREHNERVIRRIPPNQLLIMDVVAGDGWDVLCPYLGYDIPQLPFPHMNKTMEMRVKELDAAIQDIASLARSVNAFILVDDMCFKGDLAVSAEALPFLERGGQYWGRPPDDDTAIHELERMARDGAGLIVFAWPAFWWLEYYSGFHCYLRQTYPCVLENERVIAFALSQRRMRPAGREGRGVR